MSSYEQKLESARAIFDEHNAHLGDDKGKLDFDRFLAQLKNAGGTSIEALAECSYEDIAEFGQPPVGSGVITFPKLLAKRIAKIFRQKEAKSKVISEKKALLMNMRELLQAYNPAESDAVSKRLTAITQDQPCIVFKDDGTVNVDASLECLEDIKEGFEPRAVYIGSDGVPQHVHMLNTRPASAVSENPLLPGRPLRGAADTCDKTHRSWASIPQKVRVLLRLALDSRELIIDQVTRIHDTLDLLVGKTEDEMVATVSQRFHQAALLYNDKKLDGSLPTLKIVRNGSSKALKKQDPFHRHRSF